LETPVQTTVETGKKREIHASKQLIWMLDKEREIEMRLLGKQQQKRAVLVSLKCRSLNISLANVPSRFCMHPAMEFYWAG